MGERRVSDVRPLPVRASRRASAIAGVAGTGPGLRSRTATAGAPVTTSATAPAHPGLPGGAEVPPSPAEPAPDFATTHRRIYDLYEQYKNSAAPEVKHRLGRIVENFSKCVLRHYGRCDMASSDLPPYKEHHVHKAVSAYNVLQETARRAERRGNRARASKIRAHLAAIDRRAAEDLQKLTTEIDRAGPAFSPASTPPSADSPRGSATPPADRRPPGTMGERRASEPPREAQPPVRDGEQHPDLLTASHSLRTMIERYPTTTHPAINRALYQSQANLAAVVRRRFNRCGGEFGDLPESRRLGTKAEQAYRILREQARAAGNEGALAQPWTIHSALFEIDRRCASELRMLSDKHGLTGLLSVQAPPQTPAASEPAIDWCRFYRQSIAMRRYLDHADRHDDALRFRDCTARLQSHVRQRFKTFHPRHGEPFRTGAGHALVPEQMYRILQDKARRAEARSGAGKLPRICASMQDMDDKASKELRSLTSEFGPLEELAEAVGLTGWQAIVTDAPDTMPATAQATVAPPPQRPGPVPDSGSIGTCPRPAEAAAIPSVTTLPAESPGPGSRLTPAEAAPTPAASAPEVPLARRRAIVERFRSGEAAFDAGTTLRGCAADALGWSNARAVRVLIDLQRLGSSAATDPAALPEIDWSGIEALMGILDVPPPSPLPSSPSSSYV